MGLRESFILKRRNVKCCGLLQKGKAIAKMFPIHRLVQRQEGKGELILLDGKFIDCPYVDYMK